MRKEALKYVLTENTARKFPVTVPRTLELPLNTTKITTLVGIRRSGKTYILYDTMRRLEAGGVDRRQMIFLNFEDDRLMPLKSRELDLILSAHAELYPDFADRKKFFFFDEIQNAPRWESFVRRLHDTQDAQIFLTGSSSHLLARELATSLRGRTISYEVFPLSFAEFLRFRGLQHEPYSANSDSRIAAALNEYLAIGGLPEVVLADPDLRPRILKEYVDLVFYKDLVERYKVANPALLRQLLKQCLSQPATLLSPHKVYKTFRTQGYELSKDTLYRYLHYLEESYITFLLPVAERSIRKRAMNPKKLHAVDWALGYPLVPEPFIDVGHKLETAVYLHWRRQREDLAYLGGEREIDLVVNAEQPELLVNVTAHVDRPDVYEREIGGLESAAGRMPRAKRILVVQQIPARDVPKGIEVIEAWRYLLSIPAADN
ncbi:MAG: ATP-binding protein [Proteobacteria bacterium]|nr:ATP-binding protein [Pseudomonadota bacterium]